MSPSHRKRRLPAAVFCFLSGVALGFGSKPDFSGKWELMVDQSDFGNSPKPVRMTLESVNKGDVMHSTEMTYSGQQEEQTIESNWFLDGKRHPTDKPVTGYSVTKWEDDTLVNERQSSDKAYRERIQLSLSRDGKTATEIVDSKTPNGTNHTKLVWKKQS